MSRVRRQKSCLAAFHATFVLVIALPVLAAGPSSADSDKQASGYLDVGGSKIYYETRGSGAPIVLLHDGLLHAVTWDEVWQPLATRHEVIRYDRRGYGRSELPTKPYSSTEDLWKLLTHLKVQHVVLVGSSSGGALAIDFTIEHPEMVDGLFLIGPILHGMAFTESFRERARQNNEPMTRGDVKGWAKNWSEDKFLIAGANKEVRQKVYDQLLAKAEKLKAFDPALEASLSPPASQRLSEIKAPSVIVVGEADIADVRAQCDAIRAAIKSEWFAMEDAGHLIQLEKPNEIVNRLETFLSRMRH